MKTKILYIILVLVIILSAILYFHKRINNGTQQSVTLHYASALGFSFNYPKNMFVMNDPETSRIFIVPNSYKNDTSKGITTAIVISTSLNKPLLTPLQWLEDPSLGGADMKKGYSKMNIDGQEAIAINGSAWITVDTPDNKYQMSIDTLPSQNPSQLLLAEMRVVIGSLVFNK